MVHVDGVRWLVGSWYFLVLVLLCSIVGFKFGSTDRRDCKMGVYIGINTNFRPFFKFENRTNGCEHTTDSNVDGWCT